MIEVEGHVADEVVGDCLAELHTNLQSLSFLGSYPVSGEEADERRLERDGRRRAAEDWLGDLRRHLPGEA